MSELLQTVVMNALAYWAAVTLYDWVKDKPYAGEMEKID